MKFFLAAFRYISFGVFLIFSSANAQVAPAQNVVVITLDGMRWQEVFTGADSLLSFDSSAKYNTGYIRNKYWASSPEERRSKLMPFFWSELKSKGVLFGNRRFNNHVNNANPYWFSYPGYNEIFTGYPDSTVNSNDKIPNRNENVFEFMNKQAAFKGKTAVFGSWDVYSFIFNEKRSGVFVNDGFRDVPGDLNERQKIFNKLQHELPDLFHGSSERLDVATFNMGLEYMKKNKPRLMYFGFGDTDEFAHAGLYDYYLDAAFKTDQWIKQVWEYLQQDPFYRGKTTLLITTDHGRGAAINSGWTSHGSKTAGSNEMWLSAIGNAVPAEGESKKELQIQQGQLAATIAQLLGYKFKTNHPVLPAIQLNY